MPSVLPSERPVAELFVAGASEVLTCGRRSDPSGTEGDRISGGCVAVGDGKILAVGPEAQLRERYDCSAATVVDARGGAVAPGFVDAHTHLVFGGSRVREYAARLTRSREEVEDLGIETGIMATVAMTRSEDEETLFAGAASRLDQMLAHGTTTVESKSGYGLDVFSEIKILRVNRRLDDAHAIDVVCTFMGAHDFPRELEREAYVEQVIDEMIPRVSAENLADFCDVFCDEGYSTVEQSRRILEAGMAAGLAPRIHADQYSDLGGAGLGYVEYVLILDEISTVDPGV